MPIPARTGMNSASERPFTRTPFTRISPPSGRSRPSSSLRMVDFPEPLAPRMIFVCPAGSVKLISLSTTFSSKASDTRSSASTGSADPVRLPSGAIAVPA
jgi:hypothetical protein